MNTVTFPGLGLTLHLNRVAFSIGDFHVYWYGIIIAFGFFLGVSFCCANAKKFGMKPDDILDLILFVAPGGIIGARLYYIIFNHTLYLDANGKLDLQACLSIHKGGLAIYGGIIVGILITWAVAHHKKIPFPAMLDLCVFGLFLGQIAGRWGNFINGEAYGHITTFKELQAQGVPEFIIKNMYILGEYREPAFFYESTWCLSGFIAMLILRKS